jgi:hypothetical protein
VIFEMPHVVSSVAFLKLSAISNCFIGVQYTCRQSSKNFTHPKAHASEHEKHYTGGQSCHNHIISIHSFKIFSNVIIEGQEAMERTNLPIFC